MFCVLLKNKKEEKINFWTVYSIINNLCKLFKNSNLFKIIILSLNGL